MTVMATPIMFVLLLTVTAITARRRRCDVDCDCRMSCGERCVFHKTQGQMLHCSLKNEESARCFCKKGCMMMDGTLVTRKKTVHTPCNNCTCIKPSDNTAHCVGEKVMCHSSTTL